MTFIFLSEGYEEFVFNYFALNYFANFLFT